MSNVNFNQASPYNTTKLPSTLEKLIWSPCHIFFGTFSIAVIVWLAIHEIRILESSRDGSFVSNRRSFVGSSSDGGSG